jgi:ElaB/YqjD/DUF883 family membrane-anchored ribosome-binding protein
MQHSPAIELPKRRIHLRHIAQSRALQRAIVMATTKTASAKTTTSKATAAKPKAAPKKSAAQAAPAATEARAKFAKAIDEAKAGAQALGKEAQAKAGAYREELTTRSAEWTDQAKELGETAKVRARDLAVDGKAKASDAISGLGKIVAENAGSIDEKLGTRYGDYARTAARTMQETAARIEAKDIAELGDDAKEFVRKSPGLAIGIAAVAGFMLSRLFKGSSKD